MKRVCEKVGENEDILKNDELVVIRKTFYKGNGATFF